MGQRQACCLSVSNLTRPIDGRPMNAYLLVNQIFLNTAARSKATCVF